MLSAVLQHSVSGDRVPGIKQTLSEFKSGQLHSGSKAGPTVTSRKQAIAIALSEQRKAGQAKPRQTRPMPHPGVEPLPTQHTSKHH